MALFEVLQPFEGKKEKKQFLVIGEEVEMTVARANEIQANIDKEYPEYGDVLKRKDEPKSKTEAAAAEEKNTKTDEGTSDSAKK
ncbi:hypothetical protein [Macrococcus bovicus]|uniref:hypothetical protein n=1 Tax=Macrococcus bovicus TaxID=69968 RepID=UPI0025A67A10|nr:hypothetical protein [Macrococcus bovicus]WJP97069.1 hypothetical protein QSV55_07225 [Macrococcus bovicus]